jgi:hypothetical protein
MAWNSTINVFARVLYIPHLSDLLETELVLHSEIDNLNDVIKQEHAKYAEL